MTKQKKIPWDGHKEHMYKAVVKLEACLVELLDRGKQHFKWTRDPREVEALEDTALAVSLAQDQRPEDYGEVEFECEKQPEVVDEGQTNEPEPVEAPTFPAL